MNTLLTRWAQNATEDQDVKKEIEALITNPDANQIEDRFGRSLEFGTGGLRGKLGAGPNRMNIYTVRRATQGLCNYLKKQYKAPSIAIAYDSRIKSDVFAKETARVAAGNGVKAYLYPRLSPTPSLSFAVRYLHSSAGVVVTASHNPAIYNGYKVYGPDGCQMTLDAAEKTLKEINALDMFDDILLADYNQALKEGNIVLTPEGVLDAFLQAELTTRTRKDQNLDLKIVYTPLNGSGLECVTRVLSLLGAKDVTVVPSQEKPDGNFPTCPFPNPEIKEAMQEGLNLCEKLHPDLLLATDPDCDRVGIAVPKGNEYVLMTGNEVGILLTDYLIRARKEQGKLAKNPIVVSTIVSTEMINPIAREHGVEVRRVLTGFKFIGEIIGELEAKGEENRYLLGFEESYGYLGGTFVRDKDAVNGSMLICEMAAYYRARGETLYEAMEDLYKKYGYYQNGLLSFVFDGVHGMDDMKNLMEKLRENPPAQLAGLPVTHVSDFLTGKGAEYKLPASDVLEFRCGDTAKILVRPSGTEPKLKAYLFASQPTREGCTALLSKLGEAAHQLVGK